MPRRTAGGGRPERPPGGIRAGRPPSPPHNHRPEPGQVPAIFVSTASDERRQSRGHLDTLRFSLAPLALRHPDTTHPARNRPTSDRVPTIVKAFGASPRSGFTPNPPPACPPSLDFRRGPFRDDRPIPAPKRSRNTLPFWPSPFGIRAAALRHTDPAKPARNWQPTRKIRLPQPPPKADTPDAPAVLEHFHKLCSLRGGGWRGRVLA